ncbi:MAG: RHS repeat-associated core domain-containing protein [Verrucomicrobia bacterium]|jgi:RHS repeat-associated protein|nr:RHS repeat-associated core domain-containing protein [Verrucomicrobiota bacterium]OQC63003.1 MAG: tRNA nuclease WapA precursor [Verrucomicrobia bacterium ADurb.Bin006]NMD20552.1 RHS repeat-associated core domain-containing protein [Verrucomicrobiota bacterium]HOF49969.1 RHS repeat-associated core domain-containing protein [Verrucomicrobiota bacterium]HOR73067.1 RHS repeat-associated core domain-containing protein [Verrucomicrobiota bacterium]
MISTAKNVNYANAGQAGPGEYGNLKRRRFPPHPNPLPHHDGGEGEWFRVFRVVRGSAVGWQPRNRGCVGGNWSTHNYHHANGNITHLMTAGEDLAASYRYDAYGNLAGASGSLALANVYRFSSKEQHERSGLYYYGYRFYSPNWQRWLSRDPIEEWGGLNLYGFVANDPIQYFDILQRHHFGCGSSNRVCYFESTTGSSRREECWPSQ